jgi:hypothetical protein
MDKPLRPKDERTPPEGLTGRRSLQAHDEALGFVAAELAGFAQWRKQHESAHLTQETLLNAVVTRLDGVEHGQREYVAAVKRGTVSTKRIAAYAGAAVTIIGAIAAGGTQIVGAVTSEARAQSAEVSRQTSIESQRLESERKSQELLAQGLAQQRAEFQRWYHELELERQKAEQGRVAGKQRKR